MGSYLPGGTQRDNNSMAEVVKTTIVHEKRAVRISHTTAELFWDRNFFLTYFSALAQTFTFV